jgi:hypothetical protein
MMAMLGTYASSITAKNDGSFGRSFFMQESGPPRWTQQEEQQHLEMAKSDMTAAEIARTLKPTPGSIYSRYKQAAIKEQRVIAICLGMINLTAVPIPSSSWCSLSLFQFSQLLAKFSLEIADHLCRRAVQGLFRQLAASGEFDFYCMLFPTSIHDCVMERFKNLARLFSTLVHLARKQASTRGGSSIGTIKRATNLFTASFLRRGT